MDDATPNLTILDEIAIETPCRVPWNELQGSGGMKSCEVCEKHVFDLIELTSADAVRVLADCQSLPCVRICRGPDGKIVTADSPTRLDFRFWRRLRRYSGWAASLFALLFLSGCNRFMNNILQYGTPARSIKSIGVKVSPVESSTVREHEAESATPELFTKDRNNRAGSK